MPGGGGGGGGFEVGFNGNQCLNSKCEGIRGFSDRLFWSYAVGLERYR